ncbi:transposase [Scytonema sp. PCC 10023]|uniref:transposase n=1 Tax=Scytonema sp. PCC 10023 TaxID=1680591 RepID=UPI0039C75E96
MYICCSRHTKRVDLSKLVNNVKTISSRRLRSEYAEHLSQFYWGSKPQFWSGSYAIISDFLFVSLQLTQ